MVSYMIGSCPGFLSLFEPFDYRHVPELNIFSLRPYIRPNQASHRKDEAINRILRGELRNDWMLSQNTRKISWRILVRAIRANLFLAYIKNRFNNRIGFFNITYNSTHISTISMRSCIPESSVVMFVYNGERALKRVEEERGRGQYFPSVWDILIAMVEHANSHRVFGG
ncbi:MAG TPA: hypothetical protein VGA95_07905 [Thermodesulfobacteriota bacterium]